MVEFTLQVLPNFIVSLTDILQGRRNRNNDGLPNEYESVVLYFKWRPIFLGERIKCQRYCQVF